MEINIPDAHKMRLLKLGIYDEWESNFIHACLIATDSLREERIKLAADPNRSFYHFIMRSFVWASTPQGANF